MTIGWRAAIAGGVGVALALAGCGSTPKESFYTLEVPRAAGAAGVDSAPAASSPVVFVGPVTLPESVDRSAMVLRTSGNRVEISDFERWAEPLKSAVPRVLAGVLSRELGTSRVFASRQGAPQQPDYRVAVEIQRFDSSLEQGASLDALWTVTPGKGGSPRTGRTTVQEPTSSHDPAGVAAAHSRALERLGRDIAAALR